MALTLEKSQSRFRWIVIACGLAGFALFQFFGNATRGYVDTPSMFWWWISQWLNPQSETEHGWLILGISGWLLWRNFGKVESRELRVESTTSSEAFDPSAPRVRQVADGSGFIAPLAAMLGGLALHAAGFVAQQTRISIVAFLLFTWGIVALANRRWGRAAAFPLGFMVFAIPLNVLDSLGFWLRMWVVDAGGTVAQWAGIEVVRSGTQLFSPDGRFQYDVAAACSGVRSLMALAALSLLIGYLNFRSTWRRALMLLLCIPLTYLGNLARISAIIVAAEVGGQIWGERAHEVMGYGVFVIVLGGVLAASAALKQWWPESSRAALTKNDEVRIPEASANFPGRLRPASIGAAIITLVIAEMVFLGRVAGNPGSGSAGVVLADGGKDPTDLPAFIGTEWIGRRAEVTTVEREVLPADTGFSRRNYVSLQSSRHTVFLSIVLSGRDRTSIHRPEICLVGQGWTIRDVKTHEFARHREGGTLPATLLKTDLTEPTTGRVVPAVVAYWFVGRDAVVASHWQRFLHDAWSRLRHGRADRWAYVLVQADASDGETAALQRMQDVLDGAVPVFMAAPRPAQ